jgi:Ethanolamine utilization protein EutJ (predicted chaperonin)
MEGKVKAEIETSRRPKKKPTAGEAFSKCFQDYYRVVNEDAEEFRAERKQIEDTFAQQLRVLENFRKSTQETVFQEGLYFQQLRDDQG